MNSQSVTSLIGAVLDVVLCPFVVPSTLLLRNMRRVGFNRLPLCRATLLRIGLSPVRDHYYEPFVHPEQIPLIGKERTVPGIDWNTGGQLSARENAVRHGAGLLPRAGSQAAGVPFGQRLFRVRRRRVSVLDRSAHEAEAGARSG